MENIEYIMVTKWKGHWDNFYTPIPPLKSTLFTNAVIRNEELINGPWPKKAKTLFVKLNENNQFEKCWTGFSENFRKDTFNEKPVIRFEVFELNEATCPVKFQQLSSGWYKNQEKDINITPIPGTRNGNLHPLFFKEMQTCNPISFELYCYNLLRLIGIHDIHKFPQNDNRGKGDGFFIFQSLTVIYDATLETNFQKKKETQVENYVNQLRKDKVEFDSINYSIKHTDRQVWIITRDITVAKTKIEDNIKIKVIPVSKLIAIYDQRLNEEIGTDQLCNILKNLT
jgi:hypothetical protein